MGLESEGLDLLLPPNMLPKVKASLAPSFITKVFDLPDTEGALTADGEEPHLDGTKEKPSIRAGAANKTSAV